MRVVLLRKAILSRLDGSGHRRSSQAPHCSKLVRGAAPVGLSLFSGASLNRRDCSATIATARKMKYATCSASNQATRITLRRSECSIDHYSPLNSRSRSLSSPSHFNHNQHANDGPWSQCHACPKTSAWATWPWNAGRPRPGGPGGCARGAAPLPTFRPGTEPRHRRYRR